jgi:hypothetical protein
LIYGLASKERTPLLAISSCLVAGLRWYGWQQKKKKEKRKKKKKRKKKNGRVES